LKDLLRCAAVNTNIEFLSKIEGQVKILSISVFSGFKIHDAVGIEGE